MEPAAKRPLKRIAILGANGQIGRIITDHLRSNFPDTAIIACVRQKQASKANTPIAPVVSFNPFEENWQQLGKVEILINCIGIIKETKEIDFEQAHAGLTGRILTNRQKIGNPKIIQLSVLGADTASHINFLRTKGKADRMLLKHPDTVVVRPSIVCTPDTVLVQKLRLLGKISKNIANFLPFPGQFLTTKIQPILASDLAALLAILFTSDCHPPVINAVGPDVLTLQNLLSLANPKVSICKVPSFLSMLLLRIVSSFIPGLVDRTQYQLLAVDNTAETTVLTSLLRRNPESCQPFWIEELSK